jgi:hypothetical protein
MRHTWMKNGAISLVFGLTALAGCGSETSSTPDPATSEENLALFQPYLALGDSVAFGYNPVDYAAHPTQLWRFTGYPELIGLAPIPTANASCEGETSFSFLDASSPFDNGCHNDWRAHNYPLHVTYASASQSQLDYAVKYLLAHPSTKTVSVGIGANDLLILQDNCSNPATNPTLLACIGAGHAPADCVNACIAADLQSPTGTLAKAANNLATIIGTLRAVYSGQIVLVTYYTNNYANPNDPNLLAIAGLDMVEVQVAQAFGIDVAKGFSTFGAIAKLSGGDPCAAGLLYKLADGTCDKHPSAFGQSVLAAAVAAAVPAASVNASDPTTF